MALGKAGHLAAVGVKPLKSLQFVRIVKLPIAVSRPKKSLHFLVNNPNTNLHIFFNPKYHLHFFYICGGDKTETSNAEEQIVRD